MENNDEMKAQVAAAAANGQKLRVAVTKTSAQGQAAQAASPNLMSFSSDENSVWFNGKKYGVHKFDNSLLDLTISSESGTIISALNGFTQEYWDKDSLLGVVHYQDSNAIVTISGSKGELLSLFAYKSGGYAISFDLIIRYSEGKYTVLNATKDTPLSKSDMANVDKFQSALGDSVQVPSTVGGIKAGTTVAQLKGKKQNEIIDMLLFPEQQPAVANPSASIALKNAF